MNDQIEKLLVTALMTAHPKPLARLAYEVRNYQRTAAGIEAAGVKSVAKMMNAILQADFETQRALRTSCERTGDSVIVQGRASGE